MRGAEGGNPCISFPLLRFRETSIISAEKRMFMTEELDIVEPSHCFCEIPEAELRPWVEKRYRENQSTIDLMKSTDDPRQKEIISIVAMLDVGEDEMVKMMGGVDKPTHHIIHCRDNVKQMLGLKKD
jgi:hypothetical protein